MLTILAADIAGYSQHVEADEDRALGQLSALRSSMDPIIEAHGGRIANSAGDSVIASFESPVEALRAAIQFQEEHRVLNAEFSPERRMQFRVGLNIGDVSEQPGGDLLGHGVNVAARLESLAEPGGICLSKNVMDQVEGKIELAFSKVGEHRVKNLAKPITVYSVGDVGTVGSRLQRYVNRAMRHPALPLGLVLAAAAFSAATLFYVLRDRSLGSDGPQIASILKKERSPEDILSSFDLVTTGQFKGHTYHIIRTWGGTWKEVEELAEALGGYPVTIGSAAENQFVFELSLQEEGHWVVYGTAYEGPMIGLVQEDGAPEPMGGWHWSNGEETTYLNWANDGPDNWRGNQHLANFANPRVSEPYPTWGDTPGIHASVVVEIPN